MNWRKRSFLIIVIILYLLFLVVTPWSLVGLLVSFLGLYFYLQSKRQHQRNYPIAVIWLGVLIALSLSMYTVPKTELTKEASDSSYKEIVSNQKKQLKELSSSLHEVKLRLEKKQQELGTLKEELRREKELRLQTVESYKEEADKRTALENKLKEEETKHIAAKEKIDELEASLASSEMINEDESIADEEYVDEADTEVATDLEYDPSGADRDCGDFSNAQAAQDFYIAAGGPAVDPHDLDRDNDGNACDWN